MKLIEKARMIHFHRHRQERFTTGTVEALGWKRAQSQHKRFEVLASIGNLDACEILDAGCGYGDLLSFLDARFDGISYRGIDLLPEFVKTAAKRGLIFVDTKYEMRKDENGNIVLIDEIHTPDSSRYWLAESYQ